MMSEQSTLFPKQIKLDDYEPAQNNSLIILQSSNMLLGTGSRTSSTAVVLAKTLHNLSEQSTEFILKGKRILQIGCGVGLLSIYLAALGSDVVMCDTSALKDMIQRNININKKMLKGKIQFQVASWKKTKCIGCKQGQQNQTMSSASSQKSRQICLYHLLPSIDLTIMCEAGGLSDIQYQLNLMGREGMILSFMKREGWQDGLDERLVQQRLIELDFEYQIIKNYHPDYFDQRISIFRIYPKRSEMLNQKMQQLNINHEQKNKKQPQMLNQSDEDDNK